MALCGSGWSECDEEEEYGFSHGYLNLVPEWQCVVKTVNFPESCVAVGTGRGASSDTPCSSLSDGFCNHAQSPRQSDIYLSTDHSPLFTQPHITHVAQEEDCTRAHMADACIHHCQ